MGRCLPRCIPHGMCFRSAFDHKHFVVLVVCAAVIANLLNVPIPTEFQNPGGLRVVFASWKFYVFVIETVGWFCGVDNGYLFFKYTVVMAPSGLNNHGVKATDAIFDGVEVRVYEPQTLLPDNNRAVVFYHGGGWSVGNLDISESFCRRMASKTNSVIVSVNYRLAPEYFFPEPLDDCVSATRFFMERAAAYRVDPRRVAVCGDSAGGNLAAAVALRLRDLNNDPQPAAQVLIYPALQAIDLYTPSYQMNLRDPILSRENMAGFWLLYAQGHTENRDMVTANNHTSARVKAQLRATHLNYDNIPADMIGDLFKPTNTSFGDEEVWRRLKDVLLNPYFSPALAESVHGLPPSFVMSMNSDVLRDDSVLYVHRLRQAGNKITYVNYIPGYHGLLSYPLPFKDTDIAFDIVNKYILDNV